MTDNDVNPVTCLGCKGKGIICIEWRGTEEQSAWRICEDCAGHGGGTKPTASVEAWWTRIGEHVLEYAHDFVVAAPFTAKIRGNAIERPPFPAWLLDDDEL